MISKLSERAAEALFASDDISESDREMYSYGFFMMFSHLFFLALTVFYGFLFGIILESIVFYVFFTLIRGYAGGIHASTERVCTISTSLSLLLCVALIRVCCKASLTFATALMLIPSVVIIAAFSPIASHEKPLSAMEKSITKKRLHSLQLLLVGLR